MKNKITAKLSILMCLVLLISCFAACSIRTDKNETTTLRPGDSWQSGSGYEKVEISKVELVDLVKDALGDEAPENFNGDLSTLTPEQLEKVEDHAKNEGLTVEKDENGDTVIKKEEVPVTQASKDEIEDLFNKVSVKDPNNITPEEYEELSKVAQDNNLIIQTNPNSGSVEVVKPVSTTRVLTAAPSIVTKAPQTEENRTPSTSSVYRPPVNTGTVAPMGSVAKVAKLSTNWNTNYSHSGNSMFVDNDVTSDGGTVCVGITFPEVGSVAAMGLVAKYDKNGKEDWKYILEANAQTSYESVAVLSDGSIVAVGYTLGSDATTPDEYKDKESVEGIVSKFSKSGKLQWTKIIGGSGDDMIYAVAATSDGGFIIGGKSDSVDGDLSDLSSFKIKAFVFKCDSECNIVWRSGLSGTSHSAVEELVVSPSGDIFASFSVVARDGDFAALDGSDINKRKSVIAKFTSTGKRSWAKSLYESGVVNMHALTYTDDGGCILAGNYSCSNEGTLYSFKGIYNGGTAGTFDGMAVKFDSNGKRSWICPLIGFESDIITGIARVSGGYAVCGYTASTNRDFSGVNRGDYDAFVYTVNQYGRAVDRHIIGGSSADNARAACSDGTNLFVCGSTNSSDFDFAGISPAATAEKSAAMVRTFKITPQQ